MGLQKGLRVGMRFGLVSKAAVIRSKAPEPRKVSWIDF